MSVRPLPARVLIPIANPATGARLRRSSTALVASIKPSPTASTSTSESSGCRETLAGDSTSARVPATKTAPLIRQTFQYSGRDGGTTARTPPP